MARVVASGMVKEEECVNNEGKNKNGFLNGKKKQNWWYMGDALVEVLHPRHHLILWVHFFFP